jgi:hypothetical protein
MCDSHKQEKPMNNKANTFASSLMKVAMHEQHWQGWHLNNKKTL